MTALQELIEELKNNKEQYVYSDFRSCVQVCIYLAQEKLEKEKEQIVTAFTDGASWELYGYNIPYEERCLKYYKETYGN